MLRERICLLAAVGVAGLIAASPAAAAAPIVEITSPADQQVVPQADTTVAAEWTCDPAVPEDTADCEGVVQHQDGEPEPIGPGALLPTEDLGDYTLTVTGTDGADGQTVTSVTYTVVPACQDVSVTVPRKGAVTFAPDCVGTDWASVDVVGPDPAEGTVTVDQETDEITYRAPGDEDGEDGDFTGTVTFGYTVTADGGFASAERTVTVEVGPCADVDGTAVSMPAFRPDNPIELDCVPGDEPIEQGSIVPQHGDPVQIMGSVAYYKPAYGYDGLDTFSYHVAGSTIEATATIDVTLYVPDPGGGGDPGDGGGGGGGGGGPSGLQPDQPDPPAEGLPPIPFLPSLFPGGGGSGNIPTAFGRTTGLTVARTTVRTARNGRFTLVLRNENAFTVTGSATVTGAYRKTRRGKRVPRLRTRAPEIVLAARGATNVTMRLDRSDRRLLARKRKLRVIAELKVRDVERTTRTARQRLVLRAAPRRGTS